MYVQVFLLPSGKYLVGEGGGGEDFQNFNGRTTSLLPAAGFHGHELSILHNKEILMTCF